MVTSEQQPQSVREVVATVRGWDAAAQHAGSPDCPQAGAGLIRTRLSPSHTDTPVSMAMFVEVSSSRVVSIYQAL
jgi:hypothetical protein